MFDTYLTIIGNVLTEPEIRRVKDDQKVVNFRVASTARRFDRLRNIWVDGPGLRLRVSCWRQLADSVFSSVHVGDPVIVSGRLSTKDWIGDDKIRRLTYELDAQAVGHNLSHGYDKFTRRKAAVSTSATEDAETDRRVAGEVAEPLPELNSRALTQSYDEELGGFVTSVEADPYGTDDDPLGDDVRFGFPSASPSTEDGPDEAARVTSPVEDDDIPDGDSEDGAEGGDGGDTVEPGRKPRRRRQPVGV